MYSQNVGLQHEIIISLPSVNTGRFPHSGMESGASRVLFTAGNVIGFILSSLTQNRLTKSAPAEAIEQTMIVGLHGRPAGQGVGLKRNTAGPDVAGHKPDPSAHRSITSSYSLSKSPSRWVYFSVVPMELWRAATWVALRSLLFL